MNIDRKNNKVIEEWRVQAMLSYLYTHFLNETDSRAKLLTIIANYQDFVADIAHDPKEEPKKEESINDKKLKGYQFDSLVYRYIRARENMARYEWVINSNSSKSINKEFVDYQKQANRDILRFIEILNDTIGDHS